MFTRHSASESRNSIRAGFTLVEMLVAVALVLLMMVMFAEIFSLATSSMSKQKGLAELDQRQRLMSTLLRDDLKQRSFRNLYPYHPNDSTIHVQSANRSINIPFTDRLGYFYISENDPENDADDVLQFTVTKKDGTFFYGRTRELLETSTGQGAAFHPDQPENDDGAFYGEGLGSATSASAEVSYFLRNGVLHRRVLLVRRPIDPTFLDQPSVAPATTGSSALIQGGIYPVGTVSSQVYVSGATVSNRYPIDFDFSAMCDANQAIPQLVILGERSLSNESALPVWDATSLGLTKNRFGFQAPTGLALAAQYPVGLPKEYLPSGEFFGRFTHEETSHIAFGWPGDPGWGGDGALATADDTNPYTRTAGLALNPNGAVSLYANVPPNANCRQGEDILLTNVQSFDVKIWDPGASVGPDGGFGVAGIDDDKQNGIDDAGELGWPGSDDGAWADVGHTGIGFFTQANNLNPAYGPQAAPNNRCFDTWHPDLAVPGLGTGKAPFRPARVGPDGQPGRANYDDDNGDGDNDTTTGADDVAELGWPDTDDLPITVKAIQIRVRYLDLSTGLIRELTIIEQLTPDTI